MATYCEDIEWISAMFPKGKEAPEITMITLAQEGIKAVRIEIFEIFIR